MLPVTQVTPLAAKALEGGMTPRFDAALLEAAKTMRDSTPQAPELTLVPKVRQAFEAALSELSQKPLDQLKALAAMPQGARAEIASIVSHAAQAAGLNAEQTAVLNDLVPLALPRVLAYKAGIQIPGTMPAENVKNGGVQPGPQGGTPVKEASAPEKDPGPRANAQPAPPVNRRDPLPADDAAQQNVASHLAAYSQAFPAPVLVSSRTDDGSGAQSNLASTKQAPQAPLQPSAAPERGLPLTPEPQGRVIQVSSSQAPSPGPVPAEGVKGAEPGTVPVAAPSAGPQERPGMRAVPPAPLNVDEAPVAASTPGVERNAAPLERPSGPVQPGVKDDAPTAPRSVQADGRGVAAKAGLDVQFQDPSKPIAIVPGSELTLKEDGTWSQPVRNDAKPAEPSAPNPAPQARPARQDAAPQPASVKPEALPLASDRPAFTNVLRSAVEAPAPQAPVQTGKQAELVIPMAPVQAEAVSTEARASSPEPKVEAPKADAVGKPQADAFDARVAPDAVQSRRTAGDSAFQSLGQFGQDPMKTLAQLTARDYAVRESVFKQVTEALREAPDTDQGRMLIRLKPAELGEVHIDLVMADGKLSARLVASQADVRDAFVRDLPAFKAGLESQGVVVRDISVAIRADVGGQQPGQPQQQRQAAQAWWRDAPRGQALPFLSPPVNAGYGAGSGSIDQRFSAFA